LDGIMDIIITSIVLIRIGDITAHLTIIIIGVCTRITILTIMVEDTAVEDIMALSVAELEITQIMAQDRLGEVRMG
jgi:hypothetical protein